VTSESENAVRSPSTPLSVCALIPAYNEAEVIAGVVNGVRPHVARVLVVDDGSDDGTAEAAEQVGAECVRLGSNQGKGRAIRAGLAQVLDAGHTHVLLMDGDGQHRPEDVPALIARAIATGADLVIGARGFDRTRMPASRHFSNTVGSRVASWLVGARIDDSQCGFRLVRVSRLRRLRLNARRYEIEMEMLIKIRLDGGTIAHAPVAMVYAGGVARSKMHPVRDTVRICLWSLGYRFLGR
jgi:glycosyltransferase involved in cell wall biosynthesis